MACGRKYIWILIACAMILTVTGCDNNGQKPTPVEYVLYAGVHGGGGSGNAYVAIIDCTADSILDSFPVPAREILAMSASPEGKYLATNARWIWDTRSRSQVAMITPPFAGGLFPPGGKEFLAPHRDSTGIYSIPGFELKEYINTELRYGAVIPNLPLVIGVDDIDPTGPDPSVLRVVNYETREIVDSIMLAPYPGESAMIVFRLVPSPDGKHFYAEANGSRGDELVCYDIDSRKILFHRPVYAATGYCRVTPDGRELWLTDAGFLGLQGWPPYIFILDALSGVPLDSIDMRGFYPDVVPNHQYRSFEPQDIRFLPTGEKAYVNCSQYVNGHLQPLLVIDTQTREVIKLLFDEITWHGNRYDFTYLVESIDLGPKP
jgi:hypothetical protein